MNIVYLYNAATTTLDQSLIAEMTNVMENYFGNPSAIHALGREVRTLVEKARKTVSGLLNASPSEIKRVASFPVSRLPVVLSIPKIFAVFKLGMVDV